MYFARRQLLAFALLAGTAVAGLLVAAPAAEAQTSPTRIGVANPARILAEMQERKDLQAKLESDVRNLEVTRRQKQEQLQTLQAQRDQLRADTPQWQERNRELLNAAIEFETWGRITQSEMERAQKSQMRSLFDKIQQAVAEVAQQRGYDLVLAEQFEELPPNTEQLKINDLRNLLRQRNILYNSENIDITNDVITLLDSKYKSGAQ